MLTLWKRELLRFYRDKARIIGAFTPPVLFWFLIGSGLGGAFSTGGLNYLQYFYSGTLVLIVLFTSIFATISIIEDRREGFLQTVLIAPISRLEVVLGKVLGASTVGFLQGLAFLAMAPLAGLPLTPEGAAAAVAALLLCSLGLTALGFIIAWLLDSTQGFHAVMNLFLMPMWLLSGALFPYATAPRWLQLVIKANPVTYAVAGLQLSLTPGTPALASLPFCFGVLAAFAVLMLAAAVAVASRRDER
jgi:ABC-2 type transport system permease protein